MTDIQRAARFLYLQKLTFGGKVVGQSFGVSAQGPHGLNGLRIEKTLSAAHMRLARTTIEHLDWAACVARYDRPETLFYCDPPYWQTEGYGVDFGIEQYDRLAELARTIKGRMLISVGDIPEMRRAFKGLAMDRVAVMYNPAKAEHRRQMGELVIRNW